jgi:YidC/Oxa1 family membrane protein insertase
VLDVLATPVGVVLRTIHTLLAAVLPSASGLTWGLSIVLLTVTVRLVLFPLFVKQIKSQRRMQELQPLVKELQKKHKGDRETLNRELMELYKQNHANPISGCLPLLLQLPVFFALFHVVRAFGPNAPAGGKYGLTQTLLVQGGQAQIFGAPIAANFRSSVSELTGLGASSVTTVRIVAAVMVLVMGATTFWTQRQMIARAGVTDPQQVMVQKLMLYVLPLSFAVSGTIFPIGVLLYWVTTNIWSMGQQRYVIQRMPPPVQPGQPPATAPGGRGPGGGGRAPGGGPGSRGPAAAGPGADGKLGPGARTRTADAAGSNGGQPDAPVSVPEASGRPEVAAVASARGDGRAPSPARPAPGPRGRAAGARRNKNRRGGRR